MSRTLKILALVPCLAAMLFSSACGVRQYNGQLPVSAGRNNRAYGPIFASGQGKGAMSTASCGSQTGRPCVRLKASIGVPFQFDVNSNAEKGLSQGGIGYQNGPYTTTAGAGKTRVDPTKPESLSSRRAADLPRVENRDLHLIEKGIAAQKF